MKKIYNAKLIQPIYGDAFEYDNESGEFHLLKCGIIVTHRCTLKCKLCAERTPYYQNKYHPPLELLKKEIEKYFELVEYTQKFDVSGGEPLLHKDLPALLSFVLNYKRQFGRLRIVTNGTIIPSDELINALKEYGEQADVLIDNYGDNLSKNAVNLSEKLEENGVMHILRDQHKDALHFGGWVDFGDLTKKHSMEEAKKLFVKCAVPSKIGFCFRIKEGKMSPCAVTSQCMEFGVIEDNPEEYIDLFDEISTVEEKREKMKKIFNMQGFTACMYCNGFSEDSERFIPAEQL
jgi:hypothetical protein